MSLQPGQQVYSYLLSTSSPEVVDSSNLNDVLNSSNIKFSALRKVATTYADILSDVININNGEHSSQEIASNLNSLASMHPNRSKQYLIATMALYPAFVYRISAHLIDQNPIYETLVTDYLRSQKLEPEQILPRKEVLKKNIVVTPLTNSLSVTLHNQYASLKTKVMLVNPTTNDVKHIPMYYEPVQGTFSGSVFELASNTKYQVLVGTGISVEVITMPSKPPIDPNKVLTLKDIYKGGRLDIKRLKINGKPNAWAKIDGAGVVISSDDRVALDIGDASYIYFENMTIVGGTRNAVVSDKAHHLWFNECNISHWGRFPNDVRSGVGFESSSSKVAINYDAAFALHKTGTVVIENCEVHSPNGTANSWSFGHPKGPTAMLVSANHPVKKYEGQYIIRNNRFYGSYYNRYNDVVESRSNGRIWGGFVRDSAIYNNYFAYANDDAIEIDGGANNVSVYNNEIANTFVGGSAIPVMKGPAYVFNNRYTAMGDQRGKSFTQLKVGGLKNRPAGIVVINKVNASPNTQLVGKAKFGGDETYWLTNR
jgi:hypothetical protein